MSNTAYTQRANGEEKRKKSRNVFYFGISLYKPGVWARTNALLSGKPMMGRLGDLATPKQGHDLYPMGTAKGFIWSSFTSRPDERNREGRRIFANLFV
jgi:hypothetical protein